MATIQWRPEINLLTTPASYRLRFLPRNIIGYDELAAEIALDHPEYNPEAIRTILESANRKIRRHLGNGNQVTLENAFTYRSSLTGRLDKPDDPAPPVEDTVQVRVYAAAPFIAGVRHEAVLERMPAEKKLPLISTAEDALLRLDNVLNPQGTLSLTGTDLLFNQENSDEACVLQGTRSGRAVQTRITLNSNSAVMLMPDIPAQDDPWNNEYTLSITTRYTEHGTLRTGTYGRMLRTPLAVPGMDNANPPETGILTGSAAGPYVSIIGGTISGNETLRIQAVRDVQEECLFFSLRDMEEQGQTGEAVRVAGNGEYTLNGFAGSALTALEIRVDNFTDLTELVRSTYTGRMTDILEIA